MNPNYYPQRCYYYHNHREAYAIPFIPFGPANYYYSPIASRQLPSVDPEIFMHSAKEMEELMKSASVLLGKMASSKQFSFELMSAAQESKLAKVENMIKSSGISEIPKVSYNPDGLNLNFTSSKTSDDCCHLTLKLRWM